jgi:hypothetical protein
MTTLLAFIGLLIASANDELHAPLPPLELPELEASEGIDASDATDASDADPGTTHPALAKLHPEFQERLGRVFAQARANGENLRILSGFRPLNKAHARRGRASWHAFGLALDINLAEYTSMRGALKNMAQDAARWERLGRLIEAEGIIWGGRWRAEEVFHVEWHPGMPEGLNRGHLARLLALAGPDGAGYQRTWSLFTGAHSAEDHVSHGRYFKGKKRVAPGGKKAGAKKAGSKKAGSKKAAGKKAGATKKVGGKKTPVRR